MTDQRAFCGALVIVASLTAALGSDKRFAVAEDWVGALGAPSHLVFTGSQLFTSESLRDGTTKEIDSINPHKP